MTSFFTKRKQAIIDILSLQLGVILGMVALQFLGVVHFGGCN